MTACCDGGRLTLRRTIRQKTQAYWLRGRLSVERVDMVSVRFGHTMSDQICAAYGGNHSSAPAKLQKKKNYTQLKEGTNSAAIK